MLRTILLSGISLIALSSFSQTQDNMACRELYNQEKFQEAFECYAEDKEEIFSVYMAAYLAKFLEDKKAYKQWSKYLKSDAFNSSETYFYAANLFPTNSKKYLKNLNAGLKKFENDTLLLEGKVDYYIANKEYETGIPIIEQLVGLMKNDLPLYVKAGYIYSMVSKEHKAIPYYEKALEIDHNNFEANYGIGSTYYNDASGMLQESKLTEDKGEQKRLVNEAISLLKRALPYLSKAYSIDSSNTDIKSALLTCYMKLEMDQEYKDLKDK